MRNSVQRAGLQEAGCVEAKAKGRLEQRSLQGPQSPMGMLAN